MLASLPPAGTGWFYPLLKPYTRGAGTFVHVGASLVFHSRGGAAAYFQSRLSKDEGAARRGSSGAHFALFEGKRVYSDKESHKDRLWALMAHHEGYDSVQILHGPFGMPELLISRRPCLVQRRRLATCLPAAVDVRTGEDATQRCRCSESENVLNCDG